eukprot:4514510-Pyramimonas_sp.AAC.1
MSHYRVIAKLPRTDGSAVSHDCVLAQVCRPPLQALLSAHRLRLFGRILRTGPPTFWLSFMMPCVSRRGPGAR